MEITAKAFAFGEYIPALFSCDGPNTNPEIQFFNVPKTARALVLHMFDPDATAVPVWHHWIATNIDPTITSVRRGDDLIGTPCKNSWGELGYGGPCPPDNVVHRYFFRLMAIDTVLPVQEGASVQEVLDACEGHCVEQCELMGRYLRDPNAPVLVEDEE